MFGSKVQVGRDSGRIFHNFVSPPVGDTVNNQLLLLGWAVMAQKSGMPLPVFTQRDKTVMRSHRPPFKFQ